MSLILQPDLVKDHIRGFLTIEESFVLNHIKEFHTKAIEKPTIQAVVVHYARGGNLNVLKWFYHEYSDISPFDVIDSQRPCLCTAAMFGHLDIVKWAHEEQWTKAIWAISDGAGKGGHIHVLQWALDNDYLHAEDASAKAASRGHVDALRWIMDNAFVLEWGDAFCKIRSAAAKHGHLDILLLLWSKSPPTEAWQVCAPAAGGGHVALLEWLKDKGIVDNSKHVCEYAARSGHLEAVKWAMANGSSSEDLCEHAGRGGHVDVLRWAVEEQGMAWDPSDVLRNASAGGNMQVLQWLLGKGLRLYKHELRLLVDGAHTDVITWAVKNGHASAPLVCSTAAATGKLLLLKWARDKGFGWDSRTTSKAAKHGHLDTLKWAVHNGCPYDDGVCLSASKGGHAEILDWASNHGFSYNLHDLFDIAESKKKLASMAWLAGKLLRRRENEVHASKEARAAKKARRCGDM